jgi:transcriptional antiterminator RfaH
LRFSDSDDGSSWFVVKTLPNKERVARVNLEMQGVTVFCPRFRKTVRKGSRFQEKTLPLFPGYVFAALPQDPALWRQVQNSRGVAYLLRQGATGIPIPVPDKIMADLFSACEEEEIRPERPIFQRGEAVVVEQGPMSGLTAKVLTLDGQGRVAILLDIMGGVEAKISSQHLRAA